MPKKPTPPHWWELYNGHQTEYEAKNIAAIFGEIPLDLRGTLFKVGPNDALTQGCKLGNVHSDADGFVSALEFHEGGLNVKTRFVQTPFLKSENLAKKQLFSTPGKVIRRRSWQQWRDFFLGFLGFLMPKRRRELEFNLFMNMKDPANHVPCLLKYNSSHKLLVVSGAGAHFALNPESLDTLGYDDLGGKLPPGGTVFCGEWHHDPTDGRPCYLEMPTQGDAFGPQGCCYTLWKINEQGQGEIVQKMWAPKYFLLHDYALTENFIIIPGGSVYLHLKKLPGFLSGFSSFLNCFKFNKKWNTCFYVYDRRNVTAKPRKYIFPPCYPVHIANAFDNGQDVTLDINIHSTDEPIRGLTASYEKAQPSAEFQNELYRYTLKSSGEGTRNLLCHLPCEAPTINVAYEGKENRFIYAMVVQAGIMAGNQMIQTDIAQKKFKILHLEPHQIANEQYFVPKKGSPDSLKENDGYLLTIIYDLKKHQSELLVIDGTNYPKELARIVLPQPLPYNLHSTWMDKTTQNPETPAL